MTKAILVIGTYDTKDKELRQVADRIMAIGGKVVSVDVSVLGDPSKPADISKHQVAEAGGASIRAAIDSGDENTAMQIMARGASLLTSQLHAQGKMDGMFVLGGSTMGTDLALDCAQALPVGVPKYVVSAVSFSPIIPIERLSPDIQMILWSGGLQGLNAVCKSSLSQAAGAGNAVEPSASHAQPCDQIGSLFRRGAALRGARDGRTRCEVGRACACAYADQRDRGVGQGRRHRPPS